MRILIGVERNNGNIWCVYLAEFEFEYLEDFKDKY